MAVKLTEHAERILSLRYYHKNENWKKLVNRVADFVAGAEKTDGLKAEWKNKFFDAIYNTYIMPNSPTLKNSGALRNPMLAACMVLIPKDSRESIFNTLRDGVIIQSKGAGCGFNFSILRPNGEDVRGVGGKSSGGVSFMKVYDLAIGETIRQGGVRAGAMMSTFDYRHPDIEKFITCKKVEGDLTHFNVSVLVNEEFFEKVEQDKDIELWFPDTTYEKYDEEWDGDFDKWKDQNKPIKVFKTIKAKDLFNKIIEGMYANGEPGLLFKDVTNKNTPHPIGTSLIASNPCGEQSLIDGGVCNLVSIDLAKLYKNEQFDFDKFKELLQISLRFGDNSIDVSDYGLDKINKTARTYRNVGVGIMGWADLLIKMKIKYDSEIAIDLAHKIGHFMNEVLNEYSIELGKEKGNYKGGHRRNIATSSIQPTGTTSLIANTSSGIEPNFAFETLRKDESGEHKIYHSLAENYLKTHNTDVLPEYFISSKDISPLWHLKHLEVFSKYIENGISKTINAPNSFDKKELEDIIFYAYNTKTIKGFTFYRDKSRDLQVLNEVEPLKTFEYRPDRLYGYTEKIPVGNGKIYMNVTKRLPEKYYWKIRNLLQKYGEIQEIFFHYGKQGSDVSGYLDAIGRLISVSIRKSNTSIKLIIKQLKGINFAPSWFKKELTLSPLDAIAKALERELNGISDSNGLNSNGSGSNNSGSNVNDKNKDISKINKATQKNIVYYDPFEIVSKDRCPVCGELYHYEEGCVSCGCGSKCG